MFENSICCYLLPSITEMIESCNNAQEKCLVVLMKIYSKEKKSTPSRVGGGWGGRQNVAPAPKQEKLVQKTVVIFQGNILSEYILSGMYFRRRGRNPRNIQQKIIKCQLSMEILIRKSQNLLNIFEFFHRLSKHSIFCMQVSESFTPDVKYSSNLSFYYKTQYSTLLI